MEWFCLTEEQILLAPDIEIPNLEMFCNVKLDVVLNIRRSTNPNFNKDIKDEISKSCKEFKTKQIFEEYLKTIDEEQQTEDPMEKEEMAKKLEKFDMLMDKGLAVKSQAPMTFGVENKVNALQRQKIVKVIEKAKSP
jgi:hypothetical protein